MARYRSVDTSLLAQIQPITVIKAATATVSTNTTLQDDDELLFAIGASENWVVQFYLHVSTALAADFKAAITVPTSVTLDAHTVLMSTNGIGQDIGARTTTSGTGMSVTSSSGALFFVIVYASVKNSTTAGNVTLQWAQNSSDASNTQVLLGSFLQAHRVS